MKRTKKLAPHLPSTGDQFLSPKSLSKKAIVFARKHPRGLERVLLLCVLGEIIPVLVFSWLHSFWVILAVACLIWLAELERAVLIRMADRGSGNNNRDDGYEPDPPLSPVPTDDAANDWLHAYSPVGSGTN